MSRVYFTLAGKTGLIKIGFSNNVPKRKLALQTAHGESLTTILTVPGNRAEERAFHDRFEDCHERGEWFREEGKLLAYLKSHKADSASRVTAVEQLSVNVLRRGFCGQKDDLSILYKSGLPDKEVYMTGRGAETIDECLYSFRGRPGILDLASDLRLLGKTRVEIFDTLHRFEAAGIRVRDLAHPEDTTQTQMIERGIRAASMMRFANNRRAARRVGAQGGNAKGVASAERRNALIADALMFKLVAEFGAKPVSRALGAPFTASTLARHYSNNR